jgi:hypothetical protein
LRLIYNLKPRLSGTIRIGGGLEPGDGWDPVDDRKFSPLPENNADSFEMRAVIAKMLT